MYDERRVQDTVLVLLHLNPFQDSYGWRAVSSSVSWLSWSPGSLSAIMG